MSLVKLLVVGAGSCFLLLIAFAGEFNDSRHQGEQELEVRAIEWHPSEEKLKIRTEFGLPTTSEDLEKLREIGLKGQISLAGSGLFGTGGHVKVTIVMHRPTQESVRLAQPDERDMYYVQQFDGSWKSYPSQAPTLSRAIVLLPDPRQPTRATLYRVENVDGSSQGGTLFTWRSE